VTHDTDSGTTNGPRRIGFDRSLRIEWLDLIAVLMRQGLDRKTIRQRLDIALAGDIRGAEARSKTIIVLQRLWVGIPDNHVGLRDEAASFLESASGKDRLWVHWGMALLAYPFFRDVTAIAGQLGRLQGPFTGAQVHRRVVERWGERETLVKATQRVLHTCVVWNLLAEDTDRKFRHATPALHTDNRELAFWLIECALRAHESDQVPVGELPRLLYLFPFELAPHVSRLRHSGRFEFTRQGLDLDMVSLAH
jgi:hypothetical protein